jgi:phosphate transport system permease protein
VLDLDKSSFLLFILILSSSAFILGKRVAVQQSDTTTGKPHSLPAYYGYYSALWVAGPAFFTVVLWLIFESPIISHLTLAGLPGEAIPTTEDQLNLLLIEIKNVAAKIASGNGNPLIQQAADHYVTLERQSNLLLSVLGSALAFMAGFLSIKQIQPNFRARNQVERTCTYMLVACATVAIFTTVGILLTVMLESIRFFQKVPITEFLFGLKWSPQIAMRADQVGSTGAFGSIPLLAGTFLISAIAMIVAVPIGLLSAIYLSEYATPKFRAIAKPLLEILAGIPTVVYGFFAALVVAPFIKGVGAQFGLEVSSESALAAGLVMGIMIIPFVSSLSDDFINAVPQSLRDGAYALGATQSETIRQVLMPAALPGVVGGVLLAISRAIGETMIVVMAAGLTANLTANPLEAVTTVTTQIVTLLVGDQEFDSPKTLAAFALGLVLFLSTLVLNIIALRIVRKYREQYE